jgi:ferric-dicitrate binding protein FerR (iron transport regulator)
VRFALNGGEVWTKAPKLREDRGESSEIEIVSGTAVASVRGTVFGIKRQGNSTEITLAVGELKLQSESGDYLP